MGAPQQTLFSSVAPAAGGYTLVYDSSTAGGSTVNGSNSDLNYYAGHTLFNLGSPFAVGKIIVRLTSAGTITGKTYVAKIWTSNVGQDCVTAVATSDDVTGASWTDTEVTFIFSTPFTPTASTNYNITFAEKSGTSDATNYISMHYRAISGASAPAPGNLGFAWWGPNSGAPGQFGNIASTTLLPCMKIYSTP